MMIVSSSCSEQSENVEMLKIMIDHNVLFGVLTRLTSLSKQRLCSFLVRVSAGN